MLTCSIKHGLRLAAVMAFVTFSAATYSTDTVECVDSRPSLGHDLAAEARLRSFRGLNQTVSICGAVTAQSQQSATSYSSGKITSKNVNLDQISTDGSVAVIRSTVGSELKADQSGRVTQVINNGSNGYEVTIDSKSTSITYYGGLTRTNLQIGDMIKSGDTIGMTGVYDGRVGPAYLFGRLNSGEVFQKRAQSDFRHLGEAQFSLALEHWNGETVEVWIDGIYVFELNRDNGFSLSMDGIKSGKHDVKLIGTGMLPEDESYVLSRLNGKEDSSSAWKGMAIHNITISI